MDSTENELDDFVKCATPRFKDYFYGWMLSAAAFKPEIRELLLQCAKSALACQIDRENNKPIYFDFSKNENHDA